MGPKLFGLADQFPDEKVARSLTLIAKTLQSLASLVQFGEKEQYMRALNFYIVDNMKRMQAFLDSISVNTIPDDLEEMEMNLDPGRELSRLHRNLQLCNSECQDMLSKTEDMDADALNRVKAVCSAVDRMTALHIKYKLASQLRFRSQFAQLETTSENSEGEALVYSATMEPSIPVGEGDLSIAIAIGSIVYGPNLSPVYT
ncbi:hypothetical protein SARC_04171 [Sphaeroforma arctica JP610]|uniref:Ras-GAP domain-containing protein n=1 Tax=Sphaeroforma arctica JP610 TaxID=667725 RepID=A0A0L0G3B1_9EUKA|nr:hypothetical protein SARC_04171 [Sphaeroforma arctica JP610]KNC83587.1 hypothetical protein SARC_04171 [Sphaeroforma arctica JP610]|eukprot:XP_014157489.1 hypothetical protein SARC_04171 [Sphaeroforma arctica JP610]